MASQKPVSQFRMGLIVASVFANDTEQGRRYNVNIQRLYKPSGEDGKWQRSSSFGRDDLPLVSQVATRAWEWVYAQEQAERQAEGDLAGGQQGS